MERKSSIPRWSGSCPRWGSVQHSFSQTGGAILGKGKNFPTKWGPDDKSGEKKSKVTGLGKGVVVASGMFYWLLFFQTLGLNFNKYSLFDSASFLTNLLAMGWVKSWSEKGFMDLWYTRKYVPFEGSMNSK